MLRGIDNIKELTVGYDSRGISRVSMITELGIMSTFGTQQFS